MILAYPNGTMQAVKFIRETEKAWVLHYMGEKAPETRVSKFGNAQLFEGVPEAEAWIHAQRGKS